jgi:hypothetical protein
LNEKNVFTGENDETGNQSKTQLLKDTVVIKTEVNQKMEELRA